MRRPEGWEEAFDVAGALAGGPVFGPRGIGQPFPQRSRAIDWDIDPIDWDIEQKESEYTKGLCSN